MANRKVALIATGGTISTLDDSAGALVRRNAHDLVGVLGAAVGIEITPIDFAHIPGCQMTPEKMAELAILIERELSSVDVAGAVVTHGTDTIEESAYFAHLTVAGHKPVVFTGSMRTGSELSWDGPRNLLDAIKVAASPRAKRFGALLVMNEEIHSARFVTKGNGLTLGAFHSPVCGPLGRIYNGEPYIFAAPTAPRVRVEPRIDTAVAMVRALTGELAALTDARARPELHGLIVEGFGSGRVPSSWYEPMKAAIARGVVIVLASRTGAGAVGDGYGYDGSATQLLRMGLIAAHELPGHKARLKLMLALGNRFDRDRIKTFFEGEHAVE